MGDLSIAPDTGHGWLAKVLAGDPVACAVLALARNLPDAELDALILRVEQVEVEIPSPPATTAARQEVGRTSG